MKIPRGKTIEMFYAKWCPECGKVVDMIYHRNLPGIPLQECPICESLWQVNLMESSDDLIEVPDDLIIMMENN